LFTCILFRKEKGKKVYVKVYGPIFADKKANEPGRKVLTVPVGAGASKLLMKKILKLWMYLNSLE